MAAHYELQLVGRYYLFTLTADDRTTLLTSEPHTTKGAAEYAIVTVRKYSIVDACYERRIAISGASYFTLKDGNGERLANSPAYASLLARDQAIEATKLAGPDAFTRDLT